MRIPSPAGSPCKNIGLFFKRIPHQKTGDGRERRGTEWLREREKGGKRKKGGKGGY